MAFVYLIFTPPTVTRTVGQGGLYGRVRFQVGQTLIKRGAFYQLTEDPRDEDLAGADFVFLGGHDYVIRDQAEVDRLTAAGYGACFRQSKKRPFGAGIYGENNYGDNAI